MSNNSSLTFQESLLRFRQEKVALPRSHNTSKAKQHLKPCLLLMHRGKGHASLLHVSLLFKQHEEYWHKKSSCDRGTANARHQACAGAANVLPNPLTML